MRNFTLLVDKRERNPLPIPSVIEWLDPAALPTAPKTKRVMLTTKAQTLEAADYVLADDPAVVYWTEGAKGAAVVERKASIDEIGTNLFTHERRPAFIRLLSRMAERWSRPALIIEGGLITLFRPGHQYPPGMVMDGLQRLSLEYAIPIWLVDGRGLTQRLHLGEWVARYLLNATVTSLRNGAPRAAQP